MWVDQKKKQIVTTDLLLFNLPFEWVTLVIIATIAPPEKFVYNHSLTLENKTGFLL